MTSPFEGIEFTDEDPPDPGPAPDGRVPVSSPFVVLVDSNEQHPFTWDIGSPQGIEGDYRDDYAPIRVQTERRRLKVGDYAIRDIPGIAIERKSKADLYASVANKARRANFIDRLEEMSRTLRVGAVVVECYPDELASDPPAYSSLNPKVPYRTALAWSQRYPLVHWHWGFNRDNAAQVCYRLLEFFYKHEIDEKYRSRNFIIDSSIDAFREGVLARMATREISVPYPPGHPLRLQWLRGWGFYSSHFAGGDPGNLADEASWPVPEPATGRRKRGGKKPQPGGTGTQDVLRELREAASNLF